LVPLVQPELQVLRGLERQVPELQVQHQMKV
jgi:hypothetical protein